VSGSLEKPRVGGPARGSGYGGPAKGSWPPFEKGNQAARTHGGFALVALRGRADELAAGIRDVMGSTYEPRYDVAVSGCAIVLARIEAAFAALEAAEDPEALKTLDTRCRQWMAQLLSWLDKLGLTPASAAQLGLLRRVADPLKEYLEAEYGEEQP
jgi:hypothetical protein